MATGAILPDTLLFAAPPQASFSPDAAAQSLSDHPHLHGERGGGSRRQRDSFPAAGRGRSLRQHLTLPSCRRPPRSVGERGLLPSWAKSSAERWSHPTEVVPTAACNGTESPPLPAEPIPSSLRRFPRAVRIQSSQPFPCSLILLDTRREGQKEVSSKQKGMRAGDHSAVAAMAYWSQ